ncbi:hypothetical protein M3J09_007971 [Ascochyta lentis]
MPQTQSTTISGSTKKTRQPDHLCTLLFELRVTHKLTSSTRKV